MMMEKINNYQRLVDSAKKFSNNIAVTKSYITAMSTDFLQLGHLVDDVAFVNRFDAAEQDLNNIIAQWNLDKPFSMLKSAIQTVVLKIGEYDSTLVKLRTRLKEIISLPDRHNKEDVCNKVSSYLYNVRTVNYQDIDKEIKNSIPKMLVLIDGVLSGFAKEKSDLAANNSYANELIDKLEEIKSWPERHRKQELLEKCAEILFQILKSPNKSDPQSDYKKLKSVEKAIKGLTSMFEKEMEENRILLEEVKSNKHSLWKASYDKLSAELGRKSIAKLTYEPAQLKSMYQDAIKDKRTAVKLFEKEYLTPRVQKKFADRIHDLYNSCVPESFLQNLVNDIRSAKKNLWLTVLKWLGISLAIAAAILAIIGIVMFFMEHSVLFWILLIGGAILAFFIFRD